MNIPNKIRQLREIHQFTQENMAERLNMSSSAYAKLERGEQKIYTEKLEQIAKIFNMDMVDFFTDNQKLVVWINENGQHYNSHYYSSSNDLVAELEKLNLTIQFKDEKIVDLEKMLSQKDDEIQTLKTLVQLLQQSKNNA